MKRLTKVLAVLVAIILLAGGIFLVILNYQNKQFEKKVHGIYANGTSTLQFALGDVVTYWATFTPPDGDEIFGSWEKIDRDRIVFKEDRESDRQTFIIEFKDSKAYVYSAEEERVNESKRTYHYDAEESVVVLSKRK